MTTKNKTTLPLAPILFAFNTVIESQYNETKFKSLLVDSDVSTKSKSGLGQLKSL